jgi:uncharacterized protein YbjT (DUF2867 family)
VTTVGTTLVIGASGTTGSRVVAQLVAAGHGIKAARRRDTPIPGAAPVRFDWYGPSTHAAAVDGATGGQERGYHVLTFDGPGQPAAIHRDGLTFR